MNHVVTVNCYDGSSSLDSIQAACPLILSEFSRVFSCKKSLVSSALIQLMLDQDSMIAGLSSSEEDALRKIAETMNRLFDSLNGVKKKLRTSISVFSNLNTGDCFSIVIIDQN